MSDASPPLMAAPLDGPHSWRPLPVSGRSVPNLLVSATFSTSPVSYAVHVTDLAHVWSERLDRKAVLVRALQEETAIDPSEDPDNFKELLRWVGGAFDPASSVFADTSMDLSASAEQRKDDDDDRPADLALTITCILPPPLKPMRWPVRLKAGPPSAVATGLVLPLIRAHHDCAREAEALLAVIRDKDNVITRIIDRLEAAGASLEQVFTSLALAGQKKVTRQAAAARIKGLGPFDEAAFRAGLEKEATAAEDGEDDDAQESSGSAVRSWDVQELVRRVFGGDVGLKHDGIAAQPHRSPALDGWWKDISGGGTSSGVEVQLAGSKGKAHVDSKEELASASPGPPAATTRNAQASGGKKRKGKAAVLKDDDADDDDFEVLAPAKERHSLPPAPEVDDGSTESDGSDDDDGFEAPSKPAKRKIESKTAESSGSKPAAAASVKPKRMGAIGRKKQPEPEPEPEPEPQQPKAEEETGSEAQPPSPAADVSMGEADLDRAPSPAPNIASRKRHTSSPPRTSSSPPPAAATPAKRRIGRIGAASRAAKAPPAEDPPQSSATVDEDDDGGGRGSAPATRKKIGRIGKLGGKSGTSAVAPAAARPGTAVSEDDHATRSGGHAVGSDTESGEDEGAAPVADRSRSAGTAKQQDGASGGDEAGEKKPLQAPQQSPEPESRAERRKKELRNQLEKKVAAGPAKKKRKF